MHTPQQHIQLAQSRLPRVADTAPVTRTASRLACVGQCENVNCERMHWLAVAALCGLAMDNVFNATRDGVVDTCMEITIVVEYVCLCVRSTKFLGSTSSNSYAESAYATQYAR